MTIFNTLPYTLTNGTTADATQVMADLNQIVNNGNSNAAALSSTPQWVTNVAALKALAAPSVAATYQTEGYYTAGDGGAGTYWWNSTDTTADNGGTVIAPNAGGTGRWNLIYTVLNAKQFGAKGDGVTDDTAAIQAAINYVGGQGGGQIWFPIGTYICNGLILDWTHVLLIGETSGYDYEGTSTLAVQLKATSGTFAIHLKYDNTGGVQRKAFYSGLKDIAVNGTIEYGVLITSAVTIMDNVTVNGFQYGITALGQNQNKYNRIACTNNTKIGFCVLDEANLALTAPDLSFSDVHLVSSTTFTVRDSNFRLNAFGVFMRDGFLAEFKDCVSESNTQAGLMLYKPTGVNMNGLRFENCWLENNYSAYTSGSAGYSLTGITPMLATTGHFLTGSVNGDWGSVADAGYQLWVGSQTEDYASGQIDGISFVNCELNCGSNQQRYARLRSSKSLKFDGGFWQGGDGTNGLSITSYASYTAWLDFDGNNCNVTAITGGTVGGNRSFVMRRGQNSAESGGWYLTQGDWGVRSGYGIQFPATNSGSSDVNTLDDYEEGNATAGWTPAITAATPGDLAVAYSVQQGTYTKIGNKVFVRFNIATSAFTWTTASGQLRITGLPYTPLSAVAAVGACNAGGWTKASYTSICVQSAGTVTYLVLEANGSGQASASMNIADFPTGGTVTLVGSLVYDAAPT